MNANYAEIIEILENNDTNIDIFNRWIQRGHYGPTAYYNIFDEDRCLLMFDKYTLNRNQAHVPCPEDARNFGGHNNALRTLRDQMKLYCEISRILEEKELVLTTGLTRARRDSIGRWARKYFVLALKNEAGEVLWKNMVWVAGESSTIDAYKELYEYVRSLN